MATCSEDRTVQLYNGSKGWKREQLLDRFESPLYAISIANSEDILAAAGYILFLLLSKKKEEIS